MWKMLNKAYPYANNHNPGYKQKNRRKKYMKRKLLCVLLSTAMISTMISGCGSVTTTDESGNAQSSAAVASSQEAASNQSEASEARTTAGPCKSSVLPQRAAGVFALMKLSNG